MRALPTDFASVPLPARADAASAMARALLLGMGLREREALAPRRIARDLVLPDPAEDLLLQAGAGRFTAVFIRRIAGPAQRAAAIDLIRLGRWGYDINILGTVSETTETVELHLWVIDTAAGLADELAGIGHAPRAGAWLRQRDDDGFPDLAPGFAAPVFLDGAMTDPATGLRRLGFWTPEPPPGAACAVSVRGHHFVHGNYPRRSIRRWTAILPVPLDEAPSRVDALLRHAATLALTLPEAAA